MAKNDSERHNDVVHGHRSSENHGCEDGPDTRAGGSFDVPTREDSFEQRRSRRQELVKRSRPGTSDSWRTTSNQDRQRKPELDKGLARRDSAASPKKKSDECKLVAREKIERRSLLVRAIGKTKCKREEKQLEERGSIIKRISAT